MVNVHKKQIYAFGERYKAVGEEIALALDPIRKIEPETIETLKRHIGGGQSFERWEEKMKVFHDRGATSCGRIWGSEYIAYRCRTCAFNSCMSLCAPCFEAGNHEGHDFNMFKSGAGGACDCGDTNVMAVDGVCPSHITQEIVVPEPPQEILEPCTAIISSIVHRLLHELREQFRSHQPVTDYLRQQSTSSASVSTVTPDIQLPPTPPNWTEHGSDLVRRLTEDIRFSGNMVRIINKTTFEQTFFSREPEFDSGFILLVDFLTRLVQIGTTVQNMVVEMLLQPLADFEACDRPEDTEIYNMTKNQVYGQLISLNAFLEADDEATVSALRFDLTQQSRVLDEFAFWLSRMHYPEMLNNFLLHLLPNDVYKTELTGCFVKNYTFTAKSLTISSQPDALANRIVHISVQLLSNESLVMRMIEDRQLLQVFIQSLSLLFKQTLTETPQGREVVDCRTDIVQQTVYWPIISDLNNCLHHPSVAKKLVTNSDLFMEYLRIISWFTGMDVQSRAIGDHISFDRLFYVSFYLEKEGSAVPLSGIISMMTKTSTSITRQSVIDVWLTLCAAYRSYFIEQNVGTPNKDEITFSLALPRQLSAVIYHVRKVHNLTMKDLAFERNILKSFLYTAQHTICGMHEVRGRVWVRNGDNTRSLVHVYRSAAFSGTTFDLDLHLVQLVWAHLSPNMLIYELLTRLRVIKMMNFDVGHAVNEITSDNTLDEAKIASLLESVMVVVLTTIGVEKYTTDISPIDQLEKEVICVLAANNRGHADLTDQIPGLSDVQEYDVSNFRLKSTDLDKVLDEVGLFNNADGLGEGYYSLSDAGWDKYDPVFSLHRCVLVEDIGRCKLKHHEKLMKKNATSSSYNVNRVVGIYFRPLPKLSEMYSGIYDILKSSTLHSFFFITLWQRLQNQECFRDNLVGYCLAVLYWAIEAADIKVIGEIDQPEWTIFSSSDIFENAVEEIEDKGSLVELLIQLCHHPQYKRNGQSDETVHHEDNDMLELIKKLISHFAARSVKCAVKIDAIRARVRNETEEPRQADRKKIAAEVRRKMLNKMSKSAAQFRETHGADFDDLAMEIDDVDEPFCCVCRQAGGDLALMCYLHETKILDYQTTGPDDKLSLLDRSQYRETSTAQRYTNDIWQTFGDNEGPSDIFLRDSDTDFRRQRTQSSIKTCGHLTHISCHRNNNASDIVFDHPFPCPMCRCFCTILFPINKPEKPPKYGSSMETIIDRLRDNSYEVITVPEPEWFSVFVKRALQDPDELRTLPDCISLYQDMIQLDVVTAECDAVNGHKTPLQAMFIATRATVSNELENYGGRLAILLDSLVNSTQQNLYLSLTHSTPLLLLDPLRILIVLCLSTPLTEDIVSEFVQILFNLTMIQSCIKIILDHHLTSPEDFVGSNRGANELLAHLARFVQSEKDVFGLGREKDFLSSTVLTPNALDLIILDHLIPFVKSASLLWHHLFPGGIEPNVGQSADIETLCSYLGLLDGPSSTFHIYDCINTSPFPFANCVLQNFVSAARTFQNRSSPVALLLRKPVFFNPPRLLRPPVLFRDLLNACLKMPCAMCNEVPKKSVICLLCGDLLCFSEPDGRMPVDNPCSSRRRIGTSTPIRDHISNCSAGNGIFFVLFDVSILIIRNGMILRRWGSIYLDKYEEEDFRIRRGKPLYLSETRFKILEKIWISTAFPGETPRQSRERTGYSSASSSWQRFRNNL